MKYTALVDCDSFYCSCERIFAPKLVKRPVIVLSNNDGCVVALTPEAKALGIKTGTPYYQIKSLVRRHGFAVFSSNYELYGDISRRIFQILKNFSPDIENYSIDESFLGLDGDIYRLREQCEEIVGICRKWCSMPVKIGIASTKTLAKAAAHTVKKQNLISRYKILLSNDEINTVLEGFPIKDIWGIGKQTEGKLASMGVTTAERFLELDDRYIIRHFGINLMRTKRELLGIKCFDIETVPQTKKNHCYSRTFGNCISDYSTLKESIVDYASKAAANIRKMKLNAQALTVHIRTDFFNRELPQYSNSVTLSLPNAANDTFTLVESAVKGLDLIFRDGFLYKKSMIYLNDLADENIIQENMFSSVNSDNITLSALMDGINKEYGEGTIKIASSDVGGVSKWKLKREMLSSRYTTDINGLLKV